MCAIVPITIIGIIKKKLKKIITKESKQSFGCAKAKALR